MEKRVRKVVSPLPSLDVGFLGMPHLLDMLCLYGHEDVAEAVLMQDGCPSWLYEVDRGATTIWESWANIAPDGTVGTYSFNHYSFGCVVDWMVRHIGGLAELEPGFAEFEVAPHPMAGLAFCNTSYRSVRGPIRVDWKLEEERLRVEVDVPEGTVAHAKLPSWDAERTLSPGTHLLFG